MVANPAKVDRNMHVVAARLMGNTWREISTEFGISFATARGIYDRYRRRIYKQPAGRYGWASKEPRE